MCFSNQNKNFCGTRILWPTAESCRELFSSKHQLRRHDCQDLASLNDDGKGYECPHCFKPFKCNICLYAFRSSYRLEQHMKVHSREKPYSCNKCNFKTAYPSSLRNHIKTHHDSGDTPYVCTDCGASFKLPHSLSRHMLIHREKTHVFLLWLVFMGVV